MQWLTQHLCDSMFPDAPHARRHFAARGLHIVLDAFQHDRWLKAPLCGGGAGDAADDAALRAALRKRHKRDTDALRQLDTAATVQLRRFQPFPTGALGPELVQVRCSASGRVLYPPRTGCKPCRGSVGGQQQLGRAVYLA